MSTNILRRAAIAGAMVASTCVGAASCSAARDTGENVGVSTASLVTTDVMGFETTAGWTLSSGASSLTTNRTQGAEAFSLIPNGWLQLTSATLSTVPGPTNTLGIDFAMPSTAPNPNWLGTMQLSVTMPSHGLFNVLIGQTDLSQLPLGTYSSVRYAVPSNVAAAFGSTYTDLQFVLVVNVPSSTTAAYLVDNLHFVGSVADAGLDASGKDASDARSDATNDASDASNDARDAAGGDASVSCGSCPTGTACAPNGVCTTTDLTVWPNIQSQANSDPWLSQHHGQIRDLHPKVLALNFTNHPNVMGETTFAEMTDTVTKQMIPGLAEGSRYHGYSDSSAPATLHYELLKAVDLSNPTHPAPSGWNYLNSSLYPRKCAASAPYQFDYSALFNATYASYYDIRDPANPANTLNMCQLIQKGMLHEVWVYVDGDPQAWVQNGQNLVCSNGVSEGDFQLPEDLGYKQVYNAQNQPQPGQFDGCNGNGDGVSACFSPDDVATLNACGKTIRILYINSARGSGCAMHSLGHGFEGIARSTALGGPLAYLWPNWSHFANFDLNTRFNAPFKDWYGVCPSGVKCIAFQGNSPFNALTWQSAAETPSSGSMNPYNQGCGSVHFPPNARGDDDYTNTDAVLNTCTGYGHGPSGFGSDPATAYHGTEPYAPRANLNNQSYEQLVPDTQNVCGGGWQIYWRQNFPGLNNGAKDVNGSPMKNWWPFLFY